MNCGDCKHECKSLNECHAYQNFNQIVLDAKAIAQIRKSIPKATPDFKGCKAWLKDLDKFKWQMGTFAGATVWKYRFMTVTFDPKKFSFKELADIGALTSYVLNAIHSLKDYFDGNVILVREYHKSGVPHFHLNYSCPDQFCQNHVLLRMKYYFQQHLNNKHCIHDRIFNEGGKQYISKVNKQYFRFWEDMEVEE